MALFIVLWLMNASVAVKRSVSGYFRDPRGYSGKRSAGPANSGEALPVRSDNVAEIRKQIEQALLGMPEFQKIRDNIKFSVTSEGLRIDLLETEQGMFFVSGSPLPTPAGEVAQGSGWRIHRPAQLAGRRRSHGCKTVPKLNRRRGLQQLGTGRGPGQCSTPAHVLFRDPSRPGGGGPRVRRSAALERKRPRRPEESPGVRRSEIHRYSLNSSRSRRVCTRLTGTSVCFLSSIRS